MEALQGFLGYNWDIFVSILHASLTTISLFFIAIILSLPLGFGLTMLIKYSPKPLAAIGKAIVYIVRGTPLLLQLLFVFFGLPNIPGIGEHLVMTRMQAACVTFTFNYAAYFAEIFRGGLLAIDKGQYEAAEVLGFTKTQTMIKIIIPQMLRVTLPSINNEAVNLIKDTALLYAIAVPEILKVAKDAVNRDFTFSPFIIAGLVYLVLNSVLTVFLRRLEKRFACE